MKKTDIKRHKIQIVMILIVVVQCFIMIYWGRQKVGYYWDEYNTLDKAHYVSSSTPERVKLYDSEYVRYNEWMPVDEVRSTFTVSRKTSLLADSPSYILNAFINGNSYRVILNLVEAIFFEDQMTKWGAILLNIAFFGLSQLINFGLIKKITNREDIGLLAVSLYGFSGMAVSMTIFVRHYMYVTLCVSIFYYLHAVMWNRKDWRINICYLLLAAGAIYLAFQECPYALVMGGFFVIGYLIILFIQKRYKEAVSYVIIYIVGGSVYLLTQTGYIDLLIHKERYPVEGNEAVLATLYGIESLNIQNLIERIVARAGLIAEYLFGHKMIGIGVILVLGYMLAYARQKKTWGKMENVGFVVATLGSVAGYIIFSILFDTSIPRYNSFIFPLLAFGLIWIVISTGLGKESIMACVMLIYGTVLATNLVPQVDNLYRGDRNALDTIMQYPYTDSVFIDTADDPGQFAFQDFIAWTNAGTQIMLIDSSTPDYSNLPDQMLLWISNQYVGSIPEITENLMNEGFVRVDKVAETHMAAIYECNK